ncbi:MAG: hypothetical protein K9M99_06380 [Candidatus Cloacimonetes bacterium]|nr:hypothetical protein [Candidatus Cloacimonadota bacterium]
MKKMLMRFFMVLLISLVLTGCLTTEFKEYRFTINEDGSGSGSIKYINLVSAEDEGEDVSFADFQELIDDYLRGETFETDNPDYQVTSKELYEENGQICATLEFTFDHYSAADFFRYEQCNCSPMMYYTGDISETVIEIDGEKISDNESIPVYMWSPEVRNFYIKTSVNDDMSNAHDFVDLFRLWKSKQ